MPFHTSAFTHVISSACNAFKWKKKSYSLLPAPPCSCGETLAKLCLPPPPRETFYSFLHTCCSHHDQGCGDLRPGSDPQGASDPRARGLEGPRQPKGPPRSRSSGVSGRAGREKKWKVKSPGACGGGLRSVSYCPTGLSLSSFSPHRHRHRQHGVGKATLLSAYYIPGSGPSILWAHSL